MDAIQTLILSLSCTFAWCLISIYRLTIVQDRMDERNR